MSTNGSVYFNEYVYTIFDRQQIEAIKLLIQKYKGEQK